jgi:peptidoglycan L-alanyl-D-glutamate endopeptidase CwlK
MDCDIDIARFTEVPYVVERPAIGDDFADTVNGMLAKAGLRLDFGPSSGVTKEGESLVSADLPQGIGMISRDGSVSNPAGTNILISGASRPVTTSSQPAIEAALGGWKMLGHAIAGPDRATAYAFGSIMALRSGATPETLSLVMERDTIASAALSWNAAGRMAGYVEACRKKLTASNGFTTAGAVSLARTAAVVAAAGLDRENLSYASSEKRFILGVQGRIQKTIGVIDAANKRRLSSALGERFSQPSPEPTEKQALFEARPFGVTQFGPSYLPLEKFNSESLRIVQGLHPDLLRVVARASEISEQAFQVVPDNGGLRTASMQKRLKQKGASKAVLGRHTIGYAIDLVPVDERGRIDFKNLSGFETIMLAMKQASEELAIPIDWGGSWKKLVDKPHFELNRKVYPGPKEVAKPQEVFVAFK